MKDGPVKGTAKKPTNRKACIYIDERDDMRRMNNQFHALAMICASGWDLGNGAQIDIGIDFIGWIILGLQIVRATGPSYNKQRWLSVA